MSGNALRVNAAFAVKLGYGHVTTTLIKLIKISEKILNLYIEIMLLSVEVLRCHRTRCVGCAVFPPRYAMGSVLMLIETEFNHRIRWMDVFEWRAWCWGLMSRGLTGADYWGPRGPWPAGPRGGA